MPKAAALLIPATLFAIMFALALGLPEDTLTWVRRRRLLLLRVLLGSCFLVPLVALGLLKLPFAAAISPPGRFAIGLMAVCPSAPLTLRKAGKAGGSSPLAATLQVSAALAAIVSIPVMAYVLTRAHGLEGWEILPRQVARQIAVAQILPLTIGMLVRRWQPAWAQRQQQTFDRLANGLLALLIGVVLFKTGPMLVPFLGRNLLALAAMAAVVVASMTIGFLLAGGAEEQRTTAALVTSMRNPGLALLFAGIYSPTMDGLKLAILTYLLVTVLVQIPFVRWRRGLAGR